MLCFLKPYVLVCTAGTTAGGIHESGVGLGEKRYDMSYMLAASLIFALPPLSHSHLRKITL